MSEELDLSQLMNEDPTAAVPDRFPVPGGYVDFIPIPAQVYLDTGTIGLKAGGTWGFCPFGLFVTEAFDDDGKSYDGLIPFRRIESIIYDFEGFAQWQKEQDENSSD